MAAYVIADVDVKDPAAFEEYRKAVPALIEKYGGKYIVRGGTHEILEGYWEPARLVVLEFPSMEHARRFFQSKDYRPIKSLRVNSALSNLVLVEGL